MGLFGGGGGGDEIAELREQLDEIQRKQRGTPSPYALGGQGPGGGFGMGDRERGMGMADVGVSAFKDLDAEKINLDKILRQAQMPQPGQQTQTAGLPQIRGGGSQGGVRDDELEAAIRQMGGVPGQNFS